MFGFGSKAKFAAPHYGLRNVPGPGTRNAAFLPQMEDPLFSPVGTGIIPTFVWQLTAPGNYALRKQVYAGEVQGYQTGSFGGSGLASQPVAAQVIDIPGAGNLMGATG